MIGISMEWKHCPDRVEIADYGPVKQPGPGSTIIGSMEKSGLWFRASSNRRVPVRHPIYKENEASIEVSDLENPVSIRFINARTHDDFAAFHEMFGWLVNPEREEVVAQESFDARNSLIQTIHAVTSGDAPVAIQEGNRALASHRSFAPHPILKKIGKAKNPIMALQPQTLFGLMVLEASLMSVHGVRSKACGYCNKVFLTGPMTNRRSTAQYCCDKCRKYAGRERGAWK